MNCFPSNSKFVNGNINEEYFINYIFIGTHFISKKDISFKNIQVEYSYIDQWIKNSFIEIELPKDYEKENYDLVYKIKKPSSFKVVNENFDIIFFNFIHTERNLKNLKISRKEIVEFSSKNNDLLYYFDKIFYPFENFLTFIIGQKIHSRKITGKLVENDKNKIEIIYKPRFYDDEEITVNPYYFKLKFPDIKDKINEYINKWYEMSEEYKSLFELYFANKYNDSGYLETKFLYYMQAIESFHRKKYVGKYDEKDEFIELKKEFLSSSKKIVEEDFMDKINSDLYYINGYTLKARLEEIFKKYDEIKYIKNLENEEFIKKAKDTRNYLTHYDKRLENKIFKGNKLYYANQRLKMITDIIILKEWGISSERIEQVIKIENELLD